MKFTKTQIFIYKAEDVHGKKYDYSKVNYIKATKEVIIICPIHGEFTQTPQRHLRGCGCQKCGIISSSIKRSLTTEIFIKRAKEKHGDRYNYDETKYIKNDIEVIIKCPIHGPFPQLPFNHLAGCGCKKCSEKHLRDKDEFIKLAHEKHTEKNEFGEFRYNYDNINYIDSKTDIEIYCTERFADGTEHGPFPQRPDRHLFGQGCSKCAKKYSKKEQELKDFIKSLNIEFKENDRKILEGKELDIYIPEKNLAIEFNGIVFHSELYNRDKDFHYQKSLKCNLSGIKLIYIWEHLWDNEIKKDIIKSIIKQNLGLNKNINSDDCILKLIDLNNCSEFEKRKVQIFFNYNSIYEYIDSEYCLLLEYDGVIYQASLWSKILDYWELQSLINKNNYNIIGGFNKLLNYFIQEFKPNKILYKLDYNYFDKHIFDELDIKPQFKQYIYDSWNYGKLISNESEKNNFEIYNAGYNIYEFNNIEEQIQ